MKSIVLKDKIYLTGLILIIVSFSIFLFRLQFLKQTAFEFNGVFMLNYLIAVGYFFVLIVNKRLKKGRNGLPTLMLFLILALISCYSLNFDVNVFDSSTNWFCVILILIAVNYILFGWLNILPNWARSIFFAIAGLSLAVFVYLAIYLFPLYIISIPGTILFGIGLHSFVPLLFCVYIVLLLKKHGNKMQRSVFIAAFAFTFIFTTGYVANWFRNLSPVNKHYQYASMTENNGLPGWVDVAQHINKNETTEKILKTGITYAEVTGEGDFFWRMPQKNFGKRIHDPLVMISQAMGGKVNLPEEDRIKILESVYDSRHEAEDRLWSGEDIHTDQVNTDVLIWPAYHMAYTEMNITLTHAPKDEFWDNRQEAIYTFHLPEGGVVTSLSLWINGHEEKAMLTSKGKADTAYKTIVGQERRDPCVLHWHEGNTVSVRLFPVLNGQSRKFKIGITSLLKKTGQQLKYENIYFDGPAFNNAQENMTVSLLGPVKNLQVPAGFERSGNNSFRKTGNYTTDWSVSLDAAPLSGSKFQFDKYAYQMKPLVASTENFHPDFIYLDINASWKITEANQLWEKLKGRKIFVAEGSDELTELTNENHDVVFAGLCKNQFSLFPFHKIAHPEQSLVITHSGPVSPVVADLKQSKFLADISVYFKQHQSLRIFDFGSERSPYLKSLKEFRVLSYATGSITDLQQLLDINRFTRVEESSDAIALTDAGIMLTRTEDTLPGRAPDHLMRLFSYNHIMSEAGHSLLAGDQEPDVIVEEAQKAYVVSPVSSLIVLESQKDYDRFKITPGDNSLGNASLHSKGSVPEPGEWLLIIAVLLICGWIYFRPALQKKFVQR